jgi:hypothetical protein
VKIDFVSDAAVLVPPAATYHFVTNQFVTAVSYPARIAVAEIVEKRYVIKL